jgi:uncharacterized SAM-binding protein YcdF (DUF218 family)
MIWAVVARKTQALSNTARRSFDAIIVLGTPADGDGNPTPEMLDRVTEGVREYQRGVAPRLVMTGAAAHNRFIEAEVMRRVAISQGVPPAAVLLEPQALDTIQNACYSERILETHGWRSAEVVSSPAHLARAAMIFSRLPAQWRMHAAPAALSSAAYSSASSLVETIKTARYLLWARWAESCS